MRFALAMALLLGHTTVAIGNPKPNPALTSSDDQIYREKKLQIEERSKQAQKAQEYRDKKFDLKVKKITGSICVGCGSEVPPKIHKSYNRSTNTKQNASD